MPSRLERPLLPPERPSLPPERPSLPPERPSLPPERSSFPLERPSFPPERSSFPPERPLLPPGAGGLHTEATQSPHTEKGSYFPFTGERVVYSMTEGRDGRIYLLISVASGGVALDRYDPGRNLLERIPLSVKLKETFTLASGKDALYLAPWNTDGGRWKISWDELEIAPWKLVKGARIDGFKPDDAE